MKRRIAFAALFVVVLVSVSFLPLYVERTMTRVWFVDGRGESIEWGWKRCSLREFWATRRSMRREQTPAMWLGVNVGLALVYAFVATFAVSRVLAPKPRPK